MKRYPILSLVLANLVPILGVFFLGWNLFSIMFFYWLESAVIGVYNIPKMFMAQISEESDPDAARTSAIFTSTKIFSVVFFIVHFGIFMIGHGVFIFALFGPIELTVTSVLLGIVSLFISHGVSFKTNFIDGKEYEKVNLSQQMFAPYQRIILMHVSIFVVAFVVSIVGAPNIALVVMVLLKMALDLVAHAREHSRLGTYVNNPKSVH
jgi:hypothetical protein